MFSFCSNVYNRAVAMTITANFNANCFAAAAAGRAMLAPTVSAEFLTFCNRQLVAAVVELVFRVTLDPVAVQLVDLRKP